MRSAFATATVPAVVVYLDRNATVGYRVLLRLTTPYAVQTFTNSSIVYPLAAGDTPPVNANAIPLRTGQADQWTALLPKLNGSSYDGTHMFIDLLFYDPYITGAVGTQNDWHYNSTMVLKFWGYCM